MYNSNDFAQRPLHSEDVHSSEIWMPADLWKMFVILCDREGRHIPEAIGAALEGVLRTRAPAIARLHDEEGPAYYEGSAPATTPDGDLAAPFYAWSYLNALDSAHATFHTNYGGIEPKLIRPYRPTQAEGWDDRNNG